MGRASALRRILVDLAKSANRIMPGLPGGGAESAPDASAVRRPIL
jgi:hypothetical protein